MANRSIEDAKMAIVESSPESTVYVGCDSQRYRKRGVWYARYATVIILHHSGRHGASIYHDVAILPDYDNLKVRLLNEAMFATNAALELMDYLDGRLMEIHLDVNSRPEHKSHIAMNEALGYVMGNTGIRPKFKPDSWAASHCADHCVRQKPL